MRKLSKILIVLASILATRSVQAAITGEVKLWVENAVTAQMNDENATGARLHADVRLHGIEKGEVFQYEFRWTVPTGAVLAYENAADKTTTERCFQDSVYRPNKPIGDTVCSVCRPYCADTMERGCWRTRAFRTVSYVLTTKGGAKVTVYSVGAWKLDVVRLDTGVVIASGTYEATRP